MEFKHVPVLLNESIEALRIKPDGVYVDCTAGGGGHSQQIANRLTTGRLIAIDRDPEAIAVLNEKFRSIPQVTVVKDNYINILSVLSSLNISGADGILADLGVSSRQLDAPDRGFSFHQDAGLDMRMSKTGLSAADVVNSYGEKELSSVIYRYGEERYASSIARNIVRRREQKPIQTTFELVDIIKSSMPAKAMRDAHPARKTFQAIRIEVNGELEDLPLAVDNMFSSLNCHGVLAVITFHSLEDRIVKQRFNQYCTGCTCPKEFPVCVCGKTPKGKLVLKSAAPSEQELEINPRSRSARLRAVEKL